MTYIVVSENEIVKAEMERPERHHYESEQTEMYLDNINSWKLFHRSIPRIPAPGHKWKLWDEVVEGKDFKWKYEIDLKGHGDYDPCDKITYNAFLGYKQVIAIPIQPTPEGEKVEEDYRKSIEGNYVFDRNKWQATYAGDILLIHKK